MNEKGYTLVEVAVVVLLIGIMLGIAVPRVWDILQGDRMKSSARRLIGMVKELRNDAVREQVDYELHLDLDNACYWKCSADTTPEKRNEIKNRANRLSEGIKIADIVPWGQEKKTQGEAVIKFFRKGYKQPAAVHLAYGDKYMTLVFNPFMTEVKIYNRYVDVRRRSAAKAKPDFEFQ